MVLKGNRVAITALVITKNEECNIVECLTTLQWVDELIVVDAQSTDRTVSLAKGFTDNVFVKPWSGFGPQKNYGIDQSQGPWILIVDADERVTMELKEEIQRFLRSSPQSEVVGFRIPRRNYFYGCLLRHGGTYPDLQLRLFRKTAGRYNDTLIHENLMLKGTLQTLHGCLEHHSIPTITHHIRKMKQYTSLAAGEKIKSISKVTYFNLLGNHVGTFMKTLILRQGWRDGLPGVVAAMFAALHTFVKYVKVYEILEARSLHESIDHVADRV